MRDEIRLAEREEEERRRMMAKKPLPISKVPWSENCEA